MKIEGELLETLAKQDHEIWEQQKRAEGFHHTTECPSHNSFSDAHGLLCKMCSVNLVPYARLPESIKEYDRIRWRNLDEQLAKVGLKVVEASQVFGFDMLEFEALVCQREGMISENNARQLSGFSPAYGSEHFSELAESFRALKQKP